VHTPQWARSEARPVGRAALALPDAVAVEILSGAEQRLEQFFLGSAPSPQFFEF
jgi:hypothetical protein